MEIPQNWPISNNKKNLEKGKSQTPKIIKKTLKGSNEKKIASIQNEGKVQPTVSTEQYEVVEARRIDKLARLTT